MEHPIREPRSTESVVEDTRFVSTVPACVQVPPLGGVNTHASTLPGHSVAPSAGAAQTMDSSLAVQVRGWQVPATWQADGSGHTTLRHGSSGSGSTSHESPVQPASQRQTGPTDEVQPSTISGPLSTWVPHWTFSHGLELQPVTCGT